MCARKLGLGRGRGFMHADARGIVWILVFPVEFAALDETSR